MRIEITNKQADLILEVLEMFITGHEDFPEHRNRVAMADRIIRHIQGKPDDSKLDPWSEAAPTEPGLYWWRYKRSRVCIILTISRDEVGGLWVHETSGGEIPLQNWDGGLWAGPVEHPPIEDH